MNQIRINDHLTLSYGDNYREMTQEEIAGVYNDQGDNRWGIVDEDKHVMINMFWIRSRPGTGLFINIRTVAKGIGLMLKRVLPGYKKLNQGTTMVAGQLAYNTAFRYVAGETSQVGMTMVIKYQKYFYILYYYAREADGVESHKALRSIVNSFSFD